MKDNPFSYLPDAEPLLAFESTLVRGLNLKYRLYTNVNFLNIFRVGIFEFGLYLAYWMLVRAHTHSNL